MGAKHLTLTDRRIIEKLRSQGKSITEVANFLGVYYSTIWRELKKGMCLQRNSDLTEEERYCADFAEMRHRVALQSKGLEKKIVSNPELASFLEKKILEDKYSPTAALKAAEYEGYEVTICVKTLYNYIAAGVFGSLTIEKLPYEGKQRLKRPIGKVRPIKSVKGVSIEKRDESVEKREEFGHWEMDTVKGSKGTSYSMLVLTERKTRYEMIFKIRHKAEEVVGIMDRLEREYGDRFQLVFKTITSDNGAEFSYTERLAQSVLYPGERTKWYYAHPYSSWERGSNENANKMIRRHIPKGTSFDDYPEEYFDMIQNWMNQYPREVLEWNNANNLFQAEIERITPT